MGRRRTRKMRQRGSWRREWRWAERRERDSSSDIRALGASGEVVVCDARGWSERRRRRAKRRSERVQGFFGANIGRGGSMVTSAIGRSISHFAEIEDDATQSAKKLVVIGSVP
ncbi:hypothetical protein BDFG_08975 [Blastomyces dermatitidis ATCC 26199]|nr:hypothetical protein BDFG_08975 [Blastomyces dermatitidis ATCC 26199]